MAIPKTIVNVWLRLKNKTRWLCLGKSLVNVSERMPLWVKETNQP